MTTKTELALLDIHLEDILDYSFCSLLPWWKHQAAAPDILGPDTRRSGEQLVRFVVQTVVGMHAESTAKPALPLQKSFGSLWRRLLDRWELGFLDSILVEYAQKRAALIHAVQMRHESRYSQKLPVPTESDDFISQARTTGLFDLRGIIDGNCSKAGLRQPPSTQQNSLGGFGSSLGLAESFALSALMIDHLELPTPSEITGANMPVLATLQASRISFTADLVLDYGSKAVVGRPAKDAPVKTRPQVQYELFDYEDRPLTARERRFDLRLALLALAPPVNLPGAEIVGVAIRHLQSGQVERLTTATTASLEPDVIDALVIAVHSGIHSGIIVPRSLTGEKACLKCEFRLHCWSEEGVLNRLNPPLTERIHLARSSATELRRIAAAAHSTEPIRKATEVILSWMASNPALRKDESSWIFEAVAQNRAWDKELG
jgi:hypothetical protein